MKKSRIALTHNQNAGRSATGVSNDSYHLMNDSYREKMTTLAVHKNLFSRRSTSRRAGIAKIAEERRWWADDEFWLDFSLLRFFSSKPEKFGSYLRERNEDHKSNGMLK